MDICHWTIGSVVSAARNFVKWSLCNAVSTEIWGGNVDWTAAKKFETPFKTRKCNTLNENKCQLGLFYFIIY